MHSVLTQLAQADRLHADRLSDPNRSGYLPSVLDGITAQVYRIRVSAYNALAEGLPHTFVLAHYGELAKSAAKAYNTRQEQLYARHTKRTPNVGIAGYFGEEEAYMRIRHAVQMYLQLQV